MWTHDTDYYNSNTLADDKFCDHKFKLWCKLWFLVCVALNRQKAIAISFSWSKRINKTDEHALHNVPYW